MILLAASLVLLAQPGDLTPGDHARTLFHGGERREYVLHVPKKHDPSTPSPVVLALHGAGMNGAMMASFSGLNAKSEKVGFIVVYPSGAGVGPLRVWNANRPAGGKQVDDVAFLAAVLEETATLVNADPKRVYACGLSNGGMMCYRLASEMSDRIAAIAPVAGTIAMIPKAPTRPVPVIHFHGLSDTIVPYEGLKRRNMGSVRLLSAEESVLTWVKINGCDPKAEATVLTEPKDPMKAIRKTWPNGASGSEVVLITIEGGGHTWPGERSPVPFVMGPSTQKVSANDLMWEFFSKHALKRTVAP